MHKSGKLSWTTKPTPYGFPVFVVWRTVNGEKKGRVVTDIAGLLRKDAVTMSTLPFTGNGVWRAADGDIWVL